MNVSFSYARRFPHTAALCPGAVPVHRGPGALQECSGSGDALAESGSGAGALSDAGACSTGAGSISCNKDRSTEHGCCGALVQWGQGSSPGGDKGTHLLSRPQAAPAAGLQHHHGNSVTTAGDMGNLHSITAVPSCPACHLHPIVSIEAPPSHHLPSCCVHQDTSVPSPPS